MEPVKKVLLHVGCANRYYDGFINSDRWDTWGEKKYKLDLLMPLDKPWPYADGSVDGIVGMHVFQQLHWRDLVFAFREAYRVLKPGGVLRMGLPMLECTDKSLDFLLGWNNVTLLNFETLDMVLRRIGFTDCRKHWFRRGAMPELYRVDNRRNRGTVYVESIK